MRAIKMLVAALALQVAASVEAQVLVTLTNTTWKYLGNGATDQGTAWRDSSFDDSTWASGRGLFGDDTGVAGYTAVGGFATVVNGTGDSPAGPQTAYYRTTFNWVGSTAGVVLTTTNYIDDGFVMYLNGTEILRYNIATDPVVFATGADAANPAGEGVAVVRAVTLDTNLVNSLAVGPNVLAVEVHQTTGASSDHVWGASVVASQVQAPQITDTLQPTNRTILVGRSTTFVVNGVTGVPAPTIQWYRDLGVGEELIVGAVGAAYTLTNAALTDAGLYYAKASNIGGEVTSRQATLVVTADGTPPKLLSGRLGANTLEMIVVADEAVCPDDLCAGNATLTFNWEIYVQGDPSQQLGIAGITVAGNVLTFTLDGGTPWATDTSYVIGLLPFGGGSIGDIYGNLLNGGDPFSSVNVAPAASAISVKAVGLTSDLYTFDFNPSALEFSTFTWAGGNGDVSSAATMDAAVGAIDGALVIDRLPEATGNPPGTSGTARYASDTDTITTRPTGVIGNILKAHLRNDTGAAQNTALSITYTLLDRATSAEEVPGHYVYYSLSGAANSWVRIDPISGDGTAGTKTGVIDLSTSPWAAGADMYILFADDNAVGTEGIYEIDNFRAFIGGAPPVDTNAPVLVSAISGGSTTIVLNFNERMAASAGTTAPYSVSGATVTAASLSTDGREVTLTTTARPVGTSTVTITGLTDASAQANLTVPNPIIFPLTTVQNVTGWADAWEYSTNNFDAVPTWKTTGGTDWVTGNALFGFESAAVALPAPIATPILPPTSNGLTTVYFRRTVTLPALLAGQSYAIAHYTDDGAVFYIDGAEVGRFNMPGGTVTNLTLAVAASTEGVTQVLPLTATAGNRVLAAEVHQSGTNSSDIVFGARIIVVPSVAPVLTIARSGTNAVLSWNADSSWALVGSANAAGLYAPVAGATFPSFSRPLTTPATQFYKLNYVPQP